MNSLNKSDLRKIATALRLRVEACKENGEYGMAGVWAHTLNKIVHMQEQRVVVRRKRK